MANMCMKQPLVPSRVFDTGGEFARSLISGAALQVGGTWNQWFTVVHRNSPPVSTLMTPGAIERTSLCSSRAGIRFDCRYLGVWTENWRSIVINHFQCFIAPLLKISVRKQALGGFLLERHDKTQPFEPRDRLTLEAPRLDLVKIIRP